MAEIVSLKEAIGSLLNDGDTVALEGFTHLIPMSAGHEIIKQRFQQLTLVRLTPDLISDQLIGMGCVNKLVFSWGGNPGVGSLHRLRDAVEHDWPCPLEIDEHSHAGLTNRFVAGASGLPFAVMRGYQGTGLDTYTSTVAPISCPFTGEELRAVAAINPDLSVIHAQRADRKGNVQLWGITGIQKEAVLAGKRSLVTVEEIVDELDRRPGDVILPSWLITAVAQSSGGSRPSYASGFYQRDNDFYIAWDGISRDRQTFMSWMNENVL
ncbi:MAG: CoA transferase subunit A [Acidimicrobiaceae bacterium]|nr:CoA transferase subunit A [Acidimicrobiaceae bacterium]